MTAAAASVTFGPSGPVLTAGSALPLGALVLGRRVAEVADLLPRLFNLCRMAQGVAARLSLGLSAGDDDPGAEVLRDHLAQVCVIQRRAFGLAPLPIPEHPGALFGPGLPASLGGFLAWQAPAAVLVRRIAADFPPGVAVADPLPPPPDPLAEGAYENSPAARQAQHPLLRDIAARMGRGPLWRHAGLLVDLQAALDGHLPPPACRDGVAAVAAARGTYALRLTQAGGLVTGIERRTPTDHLLAPGGALAQALDRLPCDVRSLAPRLIALHDPCIPVHVKGPVDA